MIQEEWKSQSKQMETVIAMSQEGMEWCISISEEEADLECGDVTYLTTVDTHGVSISTQAQEQMVGTHMSDLYSQTNMCSYIIIIAYQQNILLSILGQAGAIPLVHLVNGLVCVGGINNHFSS